MYSSCRLLSVCHVQGLGLNSQLSVPAPHLQSLQSGRQSWLSSPLWGTADSFLPQGIWGYWDRILFLQDILECLLSGVCSRCCPGPRVQHLFCSPRVCFSLGRAGSVQKPPLPRQERWWDCLSWGRVPGAEDPKPATLPQRLRLR